MKCLKVLAMSLTLVLGTGAFASDLLDESPMSKREIDYQCKFKYELPKHGWVYCGVYGVITVREEETDQTYHLKCFNRDEEKVLAIHDDEARLTRDGSVLTLWGDDDKNESYVKFIAPRELPATVDAGLSINDGDLAKGACRFQEGDNNNGASL